MNKAIILYMPVIHQGYLDFLARNTEEDVLTRIYLLGESVTSQRRSIQKDLRALGSFKVANFLDGYYREARKSLGDIIEEETDLHRLLKGFDRVVMPNEDVCREFAKRIPEGIEVVFDNTFLRWESDNVKAKLPVESAKIIEPTEFHLALIKMLQEEAKKSPDQYRTVAAAAFIAEMILSIKYNDVVPDPAYYFYEGDPRSQLNKGKGVDLGLTIHAEAGVVADAARSNRWSLNGASIITTDFPCPPCAKLIACSGVKRLYFLDGYAMLDGERVLLEKGVEIIQIKQPDA